MDKILIIDDAESFLSTLKAYLEDSGYIIFCAKDGQEGLSVYFQESPDLVLTDLHMPHASGLDVLGQISVDNPHVPVMVISGAGELQDAIQALRLGAWDYITKPIVDLQVLDLTVKKALDRRKLLIENKQYAEKNAHTLRILKEDHEAGRRLQFNLLPADHFEILEYTIDFKIIPSLELSGDFAEYFKITDDKYGVYLADVSGHGASSAFITILLKSIINGYLTRYQVRQEETILYPDKLMSAISTELYAAQSHKYITINYGVLDIRKGEFVYGIGGHYPNPILLKQGTKASYLPGKGYPIGILDKVEYDVHKISLDAGDKIIMLSDGVLEVIVPDKDLDTRELELLKLVQSTRGELPILYDALGVSGETFKQPDDITILTIGRN